MVAVPIRLELVVKKNGKRIRDLEAHLWMFGAKGLVTRLRHRVSGASRSGRRARYSTIRPGGCPTTSTHMPPRWATLTTRACDARPRVASPYALGKKPNTT